MVKGDYYRADRSGIVKVGDRIGEGILTNMLNTGQETEEENDDAASDNYCYPSVRERQIEEQPPPDPPNVGLDDHIAQDDENITEPSENNSQVAAGTAIYPKQSLHPPNYLHETY